MTINSLSTFFILLNFKVNPMNMNSIEKLDNNKSLNFQ